MRRPQEDPFPKATRHLHLFFAPTTPSSVMNGVAVIVLTMLLQGGG
jgi:hypothetical protein